MKPPARPSLLILLAFPLAVATAPALADVIPYHVSIDVTGLTNLEMEFALYDNSGVIGDSWALLDNVTLGGLSVDFEGGTLGGFDNSLNPASVSTVAGNLNGSGGHVMRIDEDLAFTPTFTWRDFAGSSASTLEFDMAFSGSTTAGFFGLDRFVVSILDPTTLDPLLPGLTPGFGDVLAIDANGLVHTADVGVGVIPAPGSTVLGTVGLAMIAWAKRRVA